MFTSKSNQFLAVVGFSFLALCLYLWHYFTWSHFSLFLSMALLAGVLVAILWLGGAREHCWAGAVPVGPLYFMIAGEVMPLWGFFAWLWLTAVMMVFLWLIWKDDRLRR